VIARVPFGAQSGPVTVQNNGYVSNGRELKDCPAHCGEPASCREPAIDREGNVYVTYSGGRGQKVPAPFIRLIPITTSSHFSLS